MQSRFCLPVPSSAIETNFSVLRVVLPALRASPVSQMVKNLPAIRETWVWSLGQEDLPEKGMATHTIYSCLEIPVVGEAWWPATNTFACCLGFVTLGGDLGPIINCSAQAGFEPGLSKTD